MPLPGKLISNFDRNDVIRGEYWFSEMIKDRLIKMERKDLSVLETYFASINNYEGKLKYIFSFWMNV